MYRLSNEAGYALQMANACLEQAGKEREGACENKQTTTGGMTLSGPCGMYLYAIVFMKQASMMLNKVMEPPQYMILQPTGQNFISQPWAMLRQRALAEKRTAHVFERFLSEVAGQEPANTFVAVNNWSEYLARYFYTHSEAYNVQGLAAFAARLNPVFLMRNVVAGVHSLLNAAVKLKKQQLIDHGKCQSQRSGQTTKDLQTLTGVLNNASDNSNDFREGVCSLIKNIFRVTVTQEQMLRDCTLSDCMHVVGSARTKMHRLNWSIGSYGLFYRRRSREEGNRKVLGQRNTKRFHQFVDQFLAQNASTEGIAKVVQQLHGEVYEEQQQEPTVEQEPMDCDNKSDPDQTLVPNEANVAS
ncbi:Paired amphipathic helix protein Sin3b [Cichlidogyrus casuarinus]|uniref:Paired amphipathic helix protein Sin3b n=1 Tax=Cichlidogyrus casuarinus TaxID=1844966 RepID=A0ABD2Q9D3_9PLAT